MFRDTCWASLYQQVIFSICCATIEQVNNVSIQLPFVNLQSVVLTHFRAFLPSETGRSFIFAFQLLLPPNSVGPMVAMWWNVAALIIAANPDRSISTTLSIRHSPRRSGSPRVRPHDRCGLRHAWRSMSVGKRTEANLRKPHPDHLTQLEQAAADAPPPHSWRETHFQSFRPPRPLPNFRHSFRSVPEAMPSA